MKDFVWPGDVARAESAELQRICRELEDAEKELRRIRAERNAAEQERDEAFVVGKQVSEDLKRLEADRKNRVESLERLRKKAAALTAQVARLTEQRDAALERERALSAHVRRLEDFIGMEDLSSEHMLQRLEQIVGEAPATSLARLKAECWKEAYLAGMEHGHHLTVEGGYIPYDEEAAEDYVAERQTEGGNHE